MKLTLVYRASRLRACFRDGSRIRFGARQAETTPGIFSEKTLEFRDIVNNVRGNHGLKFGGEYRPELNDDNLNGGSRPLYTFAGLFNFANDAPLFYQINADPQNRRCCQRATPFPDRAAMACSSRTTGKRVRT